LKAPGESIGDGIKKEEKPRFSGGIFRKAELLFALFRYTVERLKKSEGIFSLLELGKSRFLLNKFV
jgi:hypothetical protein